MLLWQRPASAKLMPGFWELPEAEQLPQVGSGVEKGSFRHGITFHDYLFRVVATPAPLRLGICQWVDRQQLAKLPLSTVARKAMKVLERSKTKVAAERKVAAARVMAAGPVHSDRQPTNSPQPPDGRER